MGVRRLEDLIAWQLSVEFKRAVYRLIRAHGRADRDFKYRSQLFDSASSAEANVVEGFERYRAREFRLFLSYARASNAEAQRWLADGIDRGHFTKEACEPVLVLGRRAGAAIARLQQSLEPFIGPPSRPRR